MNNKIQTISDIREYLKKELIALYHEREISSIADILIKTILKTDRLHRIHSSLILSSENIREFKKLASQLKTGKPLQYVLGETSFFHCRILLNGNTLIPRQETEELVHLIIGENPGFKGKILDIGTGSGCIAIALARNLKGASVSATDISIKALRIAGLNAGINGVHVSLFGSDVLSGSFPVDERYGIIVSNPPYVTESEKNAMHSNVTGFEPHEALFVPDKDPLIFYRAILGISHTIIENRGKIYFEINESMGDRVRKLMAESGYDDVIILKDINGKNRIAKGVYYERK